MKKIEENYIRCINTPSDINEHLETLKKYSSECGIITEMGVRDVVSTWALLSSIPSKLTSYDIRYHPNIDNVKNVCNEYKIDFLFVEADVLKIQIEKTDLLFIDTLHTYNQLIAELKTHSEFVLKYIILHDTVTFGNVDESIYNHASDLTKNKKAEKQGLKNAINDFLNTELGSNWFIFSEFKNNNGLTILKRK